MLLSWKAIVDRSGPLRLRSGNGPGFVGAVFLFVLDAEVESEGLSGQEMGKMPNARRRTGSLAWRASTTTDVRTLQAKQVPCRKRGDGTEK